jgi:hypothetical protein
MSRKHLHLAVLLVIAAILVFGLASYTIADLRRLRRGPPPPAVDGRP